MKNYGFTTASLR